MNKIVHPGNILQHIMTERGLSIEELANIIGQKQEEIRDFLLCKIDMPFNLASKLESLLGIDVSLMLSQQRLCKKQKRRKERKEISKKIQENIDKKNQIISRDKEKPLYNHDCKLCIFLGETELREVIYDLYFCKGHLGISKNTIVARFGDLGYQFEEGFETGQFQYQFEQETPLAQAYLLALQKGYIS